MISTVDRQREASTLFSGQVVTSGDAAGYKCAAASCRCAPQTKATWPAHEAMHAQSTRSEGAHKRTSPFRKTERRRDKWRAAPRIRSNQVVFGLAKDLQSGRISLRHLFVIADTNHSVLSLIEQLACPWFSRSLVFFPSFLRSASFPPPPRIFLGHRAYSTYCIVLYRRIPRSPSLPLSGDRARHH